MGKGRPRITNRIRQLRLEANQMTQQALAERVGVTRQTVIAIENDRYSPSLEVAFRIARVFGVGLEDIFQYDAPSMPDPDGATAGRQSL